MELHLIWSFEAAAANVPLEGNDCEPRGVFHLRRIDFASAFIFRELRGKFTGPLAEDEQVGKRVSTQAIGPIDSGGAFPGGEQPGHSRSLSVRIDFDSAH